MTVDDPGLVWFNSLPGDPSVVGPGGDRPAELPAALHACCAAPAWIAAIAAGRPYPDRATLLDRSADVLAGLGWSDIRTALDAHPRIGERAAATGREASWSAAEQSGMDSATADVKAALVAANRAYEERFGHVFLIFATGRTDTQLLAAARQRVDNDEQTEQGVVRTELTRIVALRLTKLLDGVT